MSLHSVNPEKMSSDSLLAKVRTYYPRLNQIRSDYFESEVTVFTQISDYSGSSGYYVCLMDDYDGEVWFDASSTLSLPDALEKFIARIQTQITSHANT